MQKLFLGKLAYAKPIIWVVTLFSLVGCTTGPSKALTIQNINKSIQVLHQAAQATLAGGILKKSENNRVYFSKYHRPGHGFNTNTSGKKIRGQVVIWILGDRRPYAMKVAYRIEKRGKR